MNYTKIVLKRYDSLVLESGPILCLSILYVHQTHQKPKKTGFWLITPQHNIVRQRFRPYLESMSDLGSCKTKKYSQMTFGS